VEVRAALAARELRDVPRERTLHVEQVDFDRGAADGLREDVAQGGLGVAAPALAGQRAAANEAHKAR